MTDWIYDSEEYPNIFSVGYVNVDTGEYRVFEVSDRINQGDQLRAFILEHSYDPTVRHVGFNNEGFDYPVIHEMMSADVMTAEIAYNKAMAIIGAQDDDRFSHMIWESDRIVPQVDLFKIHHFDNRARSISLKVLEFNMKFPNIEDLPFPVGTVLDDDQKNTLISYMKNDIMATWSFYQRSTKEIAFRESLGPQYINYNDTKIGKTIFVDKLHAANIQTKGMGSPRSSIALGELIFPYVRFEHPELNRILNWFKEQTITETKGVFKDVECTIDGFKFVFGLGGIHGSVTNRKYVTSPGHVIRLDDVVSYYPNLAIKNRLFPEHLTEQFCDIYEDLFNLRKSHAKGTPENAAYKLALNGTYGNSNSPYSPFYDPNFTMSITINGQLLLCMLAEQLMKIPTLELIQINTDGVAYTVDPNYMRYANKVNDWWQDVTKLELETDNVSRFWAADVNSYIMEHVGGKIKRKGRYCYGKDLAWHQNHSAQIVAMAAEAHMVHGTSVENFIRGHTDLWDFFMNTKVPRSSRLVLVDADGDEQPLQNVTRYYVSKQGGALVKIMPPLAKKPDVWRRIGICVGWKVHPCNNIKDTQALVDYDYYIAEAEKLLV